ncbi:MAG: NUDIX hydrolase [Anaerolineales bacterium]|jgi:ADP-ribose pyrophosphatase
MKIVTRSTQQLFRGKLVSVRADRILLPGGKEATLEIVEHPNSVVLVPVDEAGRVWLVRQHRQAAGGEILELPAGTLKPGEEPEACALRELREETGMGARDLVPIGSFYLAPGYATEFMHAFLAQGLYADPAPADEDEIITTLPLPLKEVRRMIHQGQLQDAKSLAALALAFPHLES